MLGGSWGLIAALGGALRSCAARGRGDLIDPWGALSVSELCLGCSWGSFEGPVVVVGPWGYIGGLRLFNAFVFRFRGWLVHHSDMCWGPVSDRGLMGLV